MSRRARADLIDVLRRAGCVFAEEEADLLLAETAAHPEALSSLVERRISGEPLEVVLGWAEFCGVRILLDRGVFVPRQRSALLVRTAAELVGEGAIVVDLCCGSGAIGAALRAARPGIELFCADVDPVATACAQRNVGPDRVFLGDLLDPLPAALRTRVDVIVANAPYVPSADIAFMPAEARLHEPRLALDGGRDGLDLQRRIAAAAPPWLAPGGHLLVESSRAQRPVSAAILSGQGLVVTEHHDDALEATVVVGRR